MDSKSPDGKTFGLSKDKQTYDYSLTEWVSFVFSSIFYSYEGSEVMAKANSIQIKLVSTADTGFYYITRKNPRTLTEKMEKRKYDPVARKHVLFKEAKIK